MSRISNLNISFVRRNQPRRGPTSSAQQNDLQSEIITDISRIQDQWNNRLVSLTNTLPDGLGGIPDAFTNGLDGRTVYVDYSATSDSTDTKFFNISEDRPNTLKEQFSAVYGLVQTTEDTLQAQIDELSALGAAEGDVQGPNSSLDNAVARFNGTTGKIIQNSLVSINDTGVLTSEGIVNNGGLVAKPTEVSSNYNAKTTDYVMMVTVSGITIILPEISTLPNPDGTSFVVKDANGLASTGTITVSGEAGETFDGEATDTLSDDYEIALYMSWNGNWSVM